MRYCGSLNITQIWVDQGLNPCFINTVIAGILFLFMFTCSCIQCSFYRKYASNIDDKHKPGSAGFSVQVLLTFALCMEVIINAILYDTSINDKNVYGYGVFNCLALLYSWCASVRLLFLERGNKLKVKQGIRTRGHGLVLLLFWSLAFIKENIPFVSWWSHNYWWYLET